MIDKIWIQKGCEEFFGREKLKTIEGCMRLGFKYQYGGNKPENYAPLGSVDFCIDLLGLNPKPDFYPEWLKSFRNREIIYLEKDYNPFDKPYFAKSAEKYKDWDARIVQPNEKLPSSKIWLSEVINFEQEWRYYVADGYVLEAGWYQGNDEEEPAPVLDIEFPEGWCGAVDFGRTDDGKICLVESQHPFACGWYGDESTNYVKWVVAGWNYMLKG